MSQNVKHIRISEVQKHNTKSGVWIIIDNSIYDVTKYLLEHPGGEEVLLENAGTDATREFEDVGHSDDARTLMKDYKIGEVHPDDRIKNKKGIELDLARIGAISIIAGLIVGFILKRYILR